MAISYSFLAPANSKVCSIILKCGRRKKTTPSQRTEEIRARAKIEKRPLTPWEEQQIRANDREFLHCLLDSVVVGALRKWEGGLEQDVKADRPPTAQARRLLRIFATKGKQQAQGILEKYFSQKNR
jgi:hypothetical protein